MMTDEKKQGLKISTYVQIIALVLIAVGWGMSWGVMTYRVDDLEKDLVAHEQKVAILEAERGELLTKLHSIELDVREVKTIVKAMEKR